jgi:hypothetical protein
MEFVESNLTFSDSNISAVDFITIDEKIGYLIEVKDYRNLDTEFLSYKKLIPILIQKILSTLSASFPWSVKETQK